MELRSGVAADDDQPGTELAQCATSSSMRPADLAGQTHVISSLQVAVNAHRITGEAFGHTLLSGPPGVGKTTNARTMDRLRNDGRGLVGTTRRDTVV